MLFLQSYISLFQNSLELGFKGRLLWLTTASFFFYGWWDWRFLFLIIFSGLVDFAAALGMARYEKHRKLLLVLSMSANIGSLSVFKYSGFIARNLDSCLGLSGSFSLFSHIPDFFLVTPVGISFLHISEFKLYH